LDRALRRAQRKSVQQALAQLFPLEKRLVALLWHLAERWGRATTDGVALDIQLTTELVGRLAGTSRAFVHGALGLAEQSGDLQRRDDGTWVLCATLTLA
jgi:hypothetical protein